MGGSRNGIWARMTAGTQGGGHKLTQRLDVCAQLGIRAARFKVLSVLPEVGEKVGLGRVAVTQVSDGGHSARGAVFCTRLPTWQRKQCCLVAQRLPFLGCGVRESVPDHKGPA